MYKLTTLKEGIYQIKKTILEKNKYKDSTYKYFNFWKIDNPTEMWFSKFIEYHEINPLQKTVNFISVFGSEYTHYLIKSPKIFFSGEDLNNDTFPRLRRYNKICKNVNLFLGYDKEDFNNKFYLPLWYLSFIKPDASLESITSTLIEINQVTYRNDSRNKFACQIARHDKNGIREKIIMLLSAIDTVDCAGDFMKNTDDLKNLFADDKIAFLKSYKFNICPENADTPGYITEKIFDSFIAGCIPIYWSEKNLDDNGIFNKDAILFYDESDPQKLYNKVVQLYNNEKEFYQFIAQPIFNPDAPQLIINQLNKLKSRLREVID